MHGIPTLSTLYWTEDRDEAFGLQMAEHAGAGGVICFGQTHKPRYNEVAGSASSTPARWVGRRTATGARGYVLLDMSGDVPQVEFVRVEYDLEEAVAAIRRSDLPDAFADYLATGGTLRR